MAPKLQGRTTRLPGTACILCSSTQSEEPVSLPDTRAPGAGWGRKQGCWEETGSVACSPEAHSLLGEPGAATIVEISEMSLAGKQKSTSPAIGYQGSLPGGGDSQPEFELLLKGRVRHLPGKWRRKDIPGQGKSAAKGREYGRTWPILSRERNTCGKMERSVRDCSSNYGCVTPNLQNLVASESRLTRATDCVGQELE